MTRPTASLDMRGEVCPLPAMYARAKLEKMAPGQTLEVLIDHLCAVEGVPAAIAQGGHALVSVDPVDNGVYRIVVEVGGA